MLTRAWLLCLLCWLALPAGAQTLAAIPALDSPVVDSTGTLDAAQTQQLEQQALALQQRKGSQLQVLMVASTQPESIEQYSQRVFDQWTLGRKGVDDGVLLLVAKDDRKVRIQPGYGLEGAIPDAIANRIIQEYLVPHFRAGDFAGGIVAATGVLVKLVDGEALPEPVSGNDASDGQAGSGSGGGRLGGVLAGLFVGFVAASFLRAILARVPAGARGLLTGAGSGVAALLFSGLWLAAALGGVAGLIFGLIPASTGTGRYARHRDWGGWGGGGWGGGSSGGGFGGGGGWGGGGGMSGGGGASGSW